MEKLFQVGDQVRLKSGGPVMTIEKNKEMYFSSTEYKGKVFCTWFNRLKKETKLFKQETLKRVQVHMPANLSDTNKIDSVSKTAVMLSYCTSMYFSYSSFQY
jgi:uncharacterized protein YodC (DUF2158 family)